MRRSFILPAAILVAVLQIGFLLLMIQGRAAILRNGAEVMLKVRPVDPRDLLRGDYVRLGYDISSFSKSLFGGRLVEDDFSPGRTLYVRLGKGDDGFWQPVAARFDAPGEPAPEGEVDVRGALSGGWSDTTGLVLVDYGIERFYLPEGEGRQIEADMRERSFSMLVAVGGDGTAQIKAFFDGETRLYQEPLY